MSNVTSNFTHEIQLPSMGYLNPEIPDGKIVQRCITVRDQKFMVGSRSSGGNSRELLKRTIETPDNVDIDNLTVPDTLFLFFKLRSLSYGDKFSYRTRCPECGQRIDVTIDLSNLQVKTLPEDYVKSLEIVLPNSGDKVYTRILRNRDIDEIRAEVKRLAKKNGDEDGTSFVLRLVKMIKKIKLKEANADGDKVLEHPVDIQKYVEELTDLDATAIASTTGNISFGISPTVEYLCPSCREYIDLNVEFDGNFFRPKYDASSRDINL